MNIDQMLAELNTAIKGITVTATLGDTILEPQQFDRYIQQLQFNTHVLPDVRLQIMDSHKVDIDRIAFGKRIMGAPPTEGQPVQESDFVSPDFAQHKLEAAEMIGVVALTDKMLRRNIEKGNLSNTILDMIGQQSGLDIEEQGINGDTGSSDSFLALNDGWLKLTRRTCIEDSHSRKNYDDVSTPSFSTGAGETEATVWYDDVPIGKTTFQIYTTSTSGTLVADEDGDGVIDQVAASGISGTIDYNSGKIVLEGLAASTDYFVKYTVNTFDEDASTGKLWPMNMFDRMITVIPKNYFRRPREWFIYVPWWVLDTYRDQLQGRGTDLGDRHVVNGEGDMTPYKGVNVKYVPNMPENQAWLTHPDNTVYGVFHQVEVEQEREGKAKRTDIIINAETDYQFEEPEATVKALIY